jgi:hypothetical protein
MSLIVHEDAHEEERRECCTMLAKCRSCDVHYSVAEK